MVRCGRAHGAKDSGGFMITGRKCGQHRMGSMISFAVCMRTTRAIFGSAPGVPGCGDGGLVPRFRLAFRKVLPVTLRRQLRRDRMATFGSERGGEASIDSTPVLF